MAGSSNYMSTPGTQWGGARSKTPLITKPSNEGAPADQELMSKIEKAITIRSQDPQRVWFEGMVYTLFLVSRL